MASFRNWTCCAARGVLDIIGSLGLSLILGASVQAAVADAELERLKQEGQQAHYATDYVIALSKWEKGLTLARAADQKRYVGEFLGHIGVVYRNLGRYAQALEHHQQALSARRTIGDRQGEGTDLSNIGVVYRDLGRYADALEHHQQALTIRRAIDDQRGEGTDLSNIGVVYQYLGRYADALEHHQQALSIRRAIGDRRGERTDLGNIGVVYANLGRYAQALEHHQQALAIDRTIGDRRGEGVDLTNIGVVYANLGQYAQALEHYKQALAIDRAIGDRRGEGIDLTNTGNVYQYLGQYAQALEHYQRALAIRRTIGDRRGEGIDLTNIGTVYQYLDRHAEALEYYRQALAIDREIGDRRGEGADLTNIGVVYQHLGRYTDALEHYQQALAIDRAIGDRHGEDVDLGNIGVVYGKFGQYTQALEYHQQALAIQTEVGAPESLWRTWSNLRQLVRAEQANAAIFFGKQAVNTLQTMRGHIASLEKSLQRSFLENKEHVYRGLADLLIDQGRLPEAQQVLTMLKEEEYFDFIRRDARRGDIRTTRTACNADEQPWCERYGTIGDHLAALGREYAALEQKHKLGLSAEETVRLAQVKNDLKVARQAFRSYFEELLTTLDEAVRRRAVERATLEQAMDARAAEVAALKQAGSVDALAAAEVRYQAALERYAQAKGLKTLVWGRKLQQALRELGHGVVMIHTLVTDQRLRLILTTPEVQLARDTPISAKALRQAVHDFREVLTDRRRDPRPQAQALYRHLVGPFAEALEQARAQTLMLSLDGALRYLPTAALHDGERYLIERYSPVIYTAAAGLDIKDRPSPKWRAAALGLSKGVGGLSPLPAVPAELEGIVQRDEDDPDGVLPGVVHLDQAFSRDTLEQALIDGYPVLHIASHFIFRPGHHEDSHLVLGDGQPLSLARIREDDLDFGGVELMTLSACETALDGNGSEVESFGALVQEQGAKGVLATLWPVADASTGVFMQHLYRLREHALTKAEALRQAQLLLLHGAGDIPAPTEITPRTVVALRKQRLPSAGALVPDPRSPYAHPYYWAPFILMGNWL